MGTGAGAAAGAVTASEVRVEVEGPDVVAAASPRFLRWSARRFTSSASCRSLFASISCHKTDNPHAAQRSHAVRKVQQPKRSATMTHSPHPTVY